MHRQRVIDTSPAAATRSRAMLLIVINRFVIDLNPFQRWHHSQKGKIVPAYLLSLAVTKV